MSAKETTLPGEGLSTKELFVQLRGQSLALERLLLGRRSRDKACMEMTDLFLTVNAIARRLGMTEFQEAPVARDEEEIEQVPLADLMAAPPDDIELHAAEEEGVEVSDLRLRYFRQFLDFQFRGCRTAEDAMKKTLGFARRFRPESLRAFGMSKAEVARKLGESRQKVHARERNQVEKLLKNAAARGFHGLGGQRSEEHRERCRVAQKGNKSRRTGEERKRALAEDRARISAPGEEDEAA
jgi:hypothetical protein